MPEPSIYRKDVARRVRVPIDCAIIQGCVTLFDSSSKSSINHRLKGCNIIYSPIRIEYSLWSAGLSCWQEERYISAGPY